MAEVFAGFRFYKYSAVVHVLKGAIVLARFCGATMTENAIFLSSDLRALGIGRWLPDGTILDANDSLLNLIGRKRSTMEAGRLSWSEITPPEYARLDAQALSEISIEGECAPFEKEYIRSDGRRVPVLVVAGCEKSYEEGGLFYAVDLTRRKKTGCGVAFHSMSLRQRLICLLGSVGELQKQIASLLNVSVRTVELERHKIADTLGIPTSDVTLWSVEHRDALLTSLEEKDFDVPPEVKLKITARRSVMD